MMGGMSIHMQAVGPSTAELSRGVRSGSRKRAALLCAVAAMMILSDCYALFGSRISALKYVALALLALTCLTNAVSTPVPKNRMMIAAIAVAMLVLEIPYQMGLDQMLLPIGLFALLGVVICFSSTVLRTREGLLVIGLFSMMLVVVLLLISWRECLAQWRFYVGIGRPRLKGCFSNPNSLGGISSIALIMCIYGTPSTIWEVRLRKLFILLAGAAIILSGSRTSILMVVGFIMLFAYQIALRKTVDSRIRLLFLFGAMMVAAICIVGLYRTVQYDAAVTGRLQSLYSMRGEGRQLLVGLGYVSSKEVNLLTEAAGGVVDMLPVSLFYKVGIIGIIAYSLLLISTGAGIKQENKPAYYAFLFAIALQAIGESYLSSVMSFPSCFIWVLLSSLPLIVMEGTANKQ